VRLRSSLFQLLAIGQGGAILEEGDGELLLPPILQPVATLAAPLDTLNTAIPSPVSQSAIYGYRNSVAGIQAALVAADSPTLGSGIWRMVFAGRAHFTGASNANAFAEISLVDPDGIEVRFFSMAMINNAQITDSIDVVLSLAREGWIIRVNRGAMVAGDVCYVGVSAMLLKLT
jgi:hypothetical protein